METFDTLVRAAIVHDQNLVFRSERPGQVVGLDHQLADRMFVVVTGEEDRQRRQARGRRHSD